MPVRQYAVQPAKAVERAMLAEAFRLLAPFAPVEKYRYVGFGALEFVDFRLFHRQLGICLMDSIEWDTHSRQRYEFNKPFDTINLHHGPSTEKLGDVDWARPCIVWLDYTSALESSVIADLRLVTESVVPGSVIVVTLNATPDRGGPAAGRDEHERSLLASAVTAARVPPNLEKGWARGWGKAVVYRDLLDFELARLLKATRGIEMESDQILSFEYQESGDKAMMMSAAWLVHDGSESAHDALTALRTLSYFRGHGETPFRIKVPVLTVKERIDLDYRLPLNSGTRPAWVSQSDYKEYGKVYRYCPTFLGVEI